MILCTLHTSLGSWTTVKRVEDARNGHDNNNNSNSNGLGAVRRHWRIFVVRLYCAYNIRNNSHIPTVYHCRLTFISLSLLRRVVGV